jgi:hypothetical protein
LIITFLDDLYFQSKDKRFRLGFPFNITGKIPPQEYNEKGSLIVNIKKVMKRAESTMQGMLVSNFFLSVALGLAMKRIWSIINFL